MLNYLRREPQRQQPSEPAIANQRPTVIIADDDSTLVHVLTIRCQQLGFTVFRSPDAMHALLGAHRLKPNLIILDVNMPGGNGLSVCEMILGDESLVDTRVIVMTGESNPLIAERCKHLNVQYVRKGPQLWEELQEVICNRLNLKPSEMKSPTTGSAAAQPDAAVPGTRPKVLCIDDDAEITQVLKLRLERRGVDVVRAFTGMQGFWTAVDQQPQVIICDMNMPDGEGNYVNGRLKSHPVTQDIPVIILTGQASPAMKRVMIGLGVSAYLEKPLNFEELAEALSKHITLEAPAKKLAAT